MNDSATAYRVLARKYRPSTFAELIGQEAMVRTLSNAFATGRIAHAFILTGVRGVGKTTTARILARGLNCVGPDGSGGPTIAPCGVCANCRQIAEDRYSDVVEMDAASRTGVDDIRELTEGLLYRKPDLGRYRVYIIDEVHMLSRSAFNALLKTLEEPPPHAKFVFATTEIQKVPLTVLSRCQRFSLRRVPVELLAEHYRRIVEAEAVEAEPAALALIARAADGSVRDGLSLLDQAIALTEAGSPKGGARHARRRRSRPRLRPLGERVARRCGRRARPDGPPLSGRRRSADGAAGSARPQPFPDPVEAGARGGAAIRSPKATASAPARSPKSWHCRHSPGSGRCCSRGWRRSRPHLRRSGRRKWCWCASPMSPICRRRPSSSARSLLHEHRAAPRLRKHPPGGSRNSAVAARRCLGGGGSPDTPARPEAARHEPMPQSFAEVVALFDKRREAVLRSHLCRSCTSFTSSPGGSSSARRPARRATSPTASASCSSEWTGTRWLIAVSEAAGEPTLRDQGERREHDLRNEVAEHPLVQAVLETFPGATIAAVRERFAPAEPEADEPRLGFDSGDETNTEEDRDMKNLGQLMKQAQAMQEKMAEMQAQLEAVEMIGVAGGGTVRLTLERQGGSQEGRDRQGAGRPRGGRGVGGPDRRRIQRRPAKGDRSRRAGDAEADRRSSAAGWLQAAVLTLWRARRATRCPNSIR